MQILQKERIYDGNVVITDKLPETEAVEGSAAEILRIPNVYARRYANYLLNGIHLCENLEELHEYPKGGLMRDGMLAKSYAVAMMDMRPVSYTHLDVYKRQGNGSVCGIKIKSCHV